jgi:tripartite-type tricarboxylate transporter receptor subunit TctC
MTLKQIFFLVLVAFTQLANSQSLEFTVMHAPGGVSDIVTRYITRHYPDKSYVVVNRPGAAGKIAIGHLMTEKTHMLATTVQVFVTNPLNFNDLNYDPKKDLDVLATVGIMPSALLCNKKTGIESYNDFINTKKSLSFAVGGYGSSEHIATEVLLSKSKVKHIVVPYAQGGNKAVLDLLGGHVDCMFGNYPTVKSYIDNENVKLLLTSHPIGLPAPTWESIHKEVFPFQSYLSIIVPKAMSETVKAKITKDLSIAFQSTDYKQGLNELGLFFKSDTDKTKIQESLNYNDSLRKFLLDNKVKTAGQ